MNIKITGTGSYIPTIKVKNTDFANHTFLNEDGTLFSYPNEVVISKFKGITGIEERRYAEPNQCSSDLAFLAAQKAIENANIDIETIDYIILAHNFGDVKPNAIQSDILPSLAKFTRPSSPTISLRDKRFLFSAEYLLFHPLNGKGLFAVLKITVSSEFKVRIPVDLPLPDSPIIRTECAIILKI